MREKRKEGGERGRGKERREGGEDRRGRREEGEGEEGLYKSCYKLVETTRL